MVPSSGWGHPRCDIARPKSYLTKKFGRVVKAEAAITYADESNDNVNGAVTLTALRFLAWPKGEHRPATLVVPFSFQPDVECDWRPGHDQTIFIINRTEMGSYAIVSAF